MKKPARTKQKEGIVVKACIQWLWANKCEFIRNNTGAIKTSAGHYLRFGKKGSGDIVFCTPNGRYGEVECKSSTGVMSPEQEAHRKLIMARGGLYIIARGSADALENMKEQILSEYW